jgi:hypothetical protein
MMSSSSLQANWLPREHVWPLRPAVLLHELRLAGTGSYLKLPMCIHEMALRC